VDPERSFTVLERSPYYFLSEDEAGFSLWSAIGDDADEPVLTFPAGDEGRSHALAAFRRETRSGRWARFLLIVAIVAAPIWLVGELVQRWIDVFGQDAFTGSERDLHIDRLQLWSNVVGSVANAAFIIAVGLSLVIWLHRRYRREG
jgi:hypothetical protein